jgi:hypothetical protein
MIQIVLAGYPRPTTLTFRGWQGVVPTQATWYYPAYFNGWYEF